MDGENRDCVSILEAGSGEGKGGVGLVNLPALVIGGEGNLWLTYNRGRETGDPATTSASPGAAADMVTCPALLKASSLPS